MTVNDFFNISPSLQLHTQNEGARERAPAAGACQEESCKGCAGRRGVINIYLASYTFHFTPIGRDMLGVGLL